MSSMTGERRRLQAQLPWRGLAEAGQCDTAAGDDGHARDHESDQPLEHQHCSIALPRREIRPWIEAPFCRPPQARCRLGPAEHGVLPRAWQLLAVRRDGGKSRPLKPQFRHCRNAPYRAVRMRQTACPQGLRTPYLRHVQAAWMAPPRTLPAAVACLTGPTGHDPTGTNKMLAGQRFARTRASGTARAKGLNDGHFRA